MLLTVIKQHRLIIFVIVSVLLVVSPFAQQVSAQTIQQLQDQSQNLQEEIDTNNSEIEALSKKADSLQNKVSELNAEISIATTEIKLTEVKLAELKQKLVEANKELDRQKSLLKAALRALYERRGASTVELLIASDSFADFISGQEYLERLQTSIKDSADEVISLKKQIEKEKLQQEELLVTQEKQKTLLSARRQEQQEILNETEGEESRYRTLVSSQIAEREKAEAQLAALLAAGNIASLGPVSAGQKIGEVGSTGFSTGPHIHFQVYRNGSTQNPSAGGGSIINGYLWPLAGNVGYISQAYGCVAPPWFYSTQCNGGLNSFHSGLDIATSPYTSIVAVADGEIIFQGCKGGLGYVVVVDHGNGWQTWYPHQVTPSGQVYGYC